MKSRGSIYDENFCVNHKIHCLYKSICNSWWSALIEEYVNDWVCIADIFEDKYGKLPPMSFSKASFKIGEDLTCGEINHRRGVFLASSIHEVLSSIKIPIVCGQEMVSKLKLVYLRCLRFSD